MTTKKWVVGSTVRVMSGADINSIANNTGAISTVDGTSGVFTNVASGTFDGYEKCKAMLLLKAGVAAWQTGACVKLWFVSQIDGTNYEYFTTSGGVPRTPDIEFYPQPITSDQYVPGENPKEEPGKRSQLMDLPPGTWKVFVLMVGMGQSTAAAANEIRIQPCTPTDV